MRDKSISDLDFLKICAHLTEAELRKSRKCKDVERCRELKKSLKNIKSDIKHINDKEGI